MLNWIYKIIGIKRCEHEYEIIEKNEIHQIPKNYHYYSYGIQSEEPIHIGFTYIQRCKKCGKMKMDKFLID